MYKRNKYIFAKFMHSNYMHSGVRNGHSWSTSPHARPAVEPRGGQDFIRKFITLLRANYVTYIHIFTYRVYKKMSRNKINIYLHIHVTLGVFVPGIEISTHGSSDALQTQLCCQHFTSSISINRLHKPYISYRPKYH